MQAILIEDNISDQKLAQRAFADVDKNFRLTCLSSGEEAIEHFANFDSQSKLPQFVLLDLNLLGVSGVEVLSFIKRHQRLKVVPVIILSTSNSPADIAKAYENCANCYVHKPISYDAFSRLIERIYEFWGREICSSSVH